MNIHILFPEWIGQNHYRLHNVTEGIHYWKNEYGVKTTQELYQIFLEETIFSLSSFQ
jgi:hypothetical protein